MNMNEKGMKGETSRRGEEKLQSISFQELEELGLHGDFESEEEEKILNLKDLYEETIQPPTHSILDEWDLYDDEEPIQRMQASLSASRIEGDAIQQVATLAQTSLKRLQLVVKEKDETIQTLQDAVASAYKSTLEQQERDQQDMEDLHQLLLAHDSRTLESMQARLKEVMRQQPEGGSTLAGKVAALFDDYLHEVTRVNDMECRELRRSLTMLTSRCQELEAQLKHEKEHWDAHLKTSLEDKSGCRRWIGRSLLGT